MGYGFWGILLDVDLKTGQIEERQVPEEDYRRYLGGSGLAAKILFEELDPRVDPLAPENTLAFMAGLVTGTVVPCACRTVICARSPLTGIWNESAAGGYWGANLRFSGYDGIIIRNWSEKPVYLWVSDQGVELRDATHLWGMDTFETDEALRRETHPRARVAAIGPAGERMVRFASVTYEGRMSRASGRAGMGAIMGSKNLKAVVAYGKKRVDLKDKDGLHRLLREDVPILKKGAAGLTAYGTPGGVEAVEFTGDLPIKNWQLGTYKEGANKTAGQTNLPRYLDSHHTCHACPIRCAKTVRITEGPYAGISGHQPEYETIAGFGANCLNDNWEVIAAANDKCNRYGLDTISTSAAVAFTMEAYEHGIITKEETDGVEATWGSAEAILKVVDLIAERRALGDLLAQGTRRAAQKLGGLAPEFLAQAKGLEIAFHDPRGFTSMAVNYATANRGGCHLEGLTYFIGRGVPLADMGYTEPPPAHVTEGKAKLCYDLQNYMAIFNPLGLCKFLFIGRAGPKMIASWLEKVTGWEMDQESLIGLGEKIFNLKRMYNVRLGISRKDDTLSPRMLAEPKPDGKAAGVVPHLGLMLSEYYRLRGWSKEGIPAPETLDRQGLGWTLDYLDR
ncbi:MAG: aldehyde ferredoxin oxidoreductase family protein [Deltaproteobacteria bacterium]|nr:aldehyde ferredoxin oxidoreductase family protein [Deltaproteobacteria bacterium]